jgi:hypothetical protein
MSCGVTPKAFMRSLSIRHAQHVIGAAERGHVARSLDSLEVDFGCARHLLQIERRALGSVVQKVSETIGTSSMPFGLTTGSSTPSSATASRLLECTVS